jgi:ketosteroid isomerase-like protein
MADIIERYLGAIASQDWGVVNDCIADDVVRVGPYGDRFAGRDTYLAYICDTMPRLEGYSMKIERVTYAGEAVGFAELSEIVAFDGKPQRTQEVLVFAIDAGGRISRVDIFMQAPQPWPPQAESAGPRR